MVEDKLWIFVFYEFYFRSAMDELFHEKELKDIGPYVYWTVHHLDS